MYVVLRIKDMILENDSFFFLVLIQNYANKYFIYIAVYFIPISYLIYLYVTLFSIHVYNSSKIIIGYTKQF